jgi:hypothetical protein
MGGSEGVNVTEYSETQTRSLNDLSDEGGNIQPYMKQTELKDKKVYTLFRGFRKHSKPFHSCCIQLSSLTIIAYFRGD